VFEGDGMARDLIICCDGTGNDTVGAVTNVFRLYRCLDRNDAAQLAYYDAGVGTLTDPRLLWPWQRTVRKRLDSAIGLSIRDNFCEAYRFLMAHYRAGDRVWLFGFSRGAYTVRVLAAALRMLGLLPNHLEPLIPYVWAILADPDEQYRVSARFSGGNRFRKSFCLGVPVRTHFLGVWDTVPAFGWMWDPKAVPYTVNNDSIDHIRHAMAIDECRVCFEPLQCGRQRCGSEDRFKEIWFAGVHSDVGGGYAEHESGLAKISLEWMLLEAVAKGLRIDLAEAQRWVCGGKNGEVAPNAHAQRHESLHGPWHIMEALPRRVWAAQETRFCWAGPHRGRARLIPAESTVHESVLSRVDWPTRYRSLQTGTAED
jgi:uncharacterized protein (DUF2235 family)